MNVDPAYLVEHVRERLATDPRCSELHVDVAIVGKKVFLTGEVATEARRQAVGAVVAELLPAYQVHNETSVTKITPPGAREELE